MLLRGWSNCSTASLRRRLRSWSVGPAAAAGAAATAAAGAWVGTQAAAAEQAAMAAAVKDSVLLHLPICAGSSGAPADA